MKSNKVLENATKAYNEWNKKIKNDDGDALIYDAFLAGYKAASKNLEKKKFSFQTKEGDTK